VELDDIGCTTTATQRFQLSYPEGPGQPRKATCEPNKPKKQPSAVTRSNRDRQAPLMILYSYTGSLCSNNTRGWASSARRLRPVKFFEKRHIEGRDLDLSPAVRMPYRRPRNKGNSFCRRAIGLRGAFERSGEVVRAVWGSILIVCARWAVVENEASSQRQKNSVAYCSVQAS
jgi:hypothetical protein